MANDDRYAYECGYMDALKGRREKRSDRAPYVEGYLDAIEARGFGVESDHAVAVMYAIKASGFSRWAVRPDGPETAYGGLVGQQPY